MARDFVTIANLAVGFVGDDDQIREPSEDSKPARTVRAAWESVRQFVICAAEWNFAMRRAWLPAREISIEKPVIGFQNAYPLPHDCLRFVELLELQDVRYQIENGEILADWTGALPIRYEVDVAETALWSPEFVEAFSMRLAWQIADRLSGDKQRKQQAKDAYDGVIRKARGTDARQNPPRTHPETDWSRARRAGTARAPNT
jgi:hypothetical protein